MGDAFLAKIASWDPDLVQNGRCSPIEVLLYSIIFVHMMSFNM